MKVRTNDLQNTIVFWRRVAEQNGWGDQYESADLTIWVDEEGRITDSVATATGGGLIYVQEDTDRHGDHTS